MAVPVIVGILRRRPFVRIRNGGRIREVGGLFMNLAQLRRKGLSKCSSCKKQRGLRCFVGVDSLRKMTVESVIWQGWQAGQALRAARKGRLFPSYSFQVVPRRFSPRRNAGRSRADRKMWTERWIEQDADRWQSGGLRNQYHDLLIMIVNPF
jgi:hypothetical protein